MKNKKVIILNGSEQKDSYAEAPLSELINILNCNNSDVKIYHLNKIKIAHCIGCFGCWVKTPGICRADDKGREIIKSVVQSDLTIFYSPVTFGGYSSALKLIVDRFIPIGLPFFVQYHGETHHPPRYSHHPKLVGIGIRNHDRIDEDQLFKALVGRNALNFHAPSYAAEVINCNDDNETIREILKSVIIRSDHLPAGNEVSSFFPETTLEKLSDVKAKVPGKALLIVGSPKLKSPSTSAVLGRYILDKMNTAGWKTMSLTLKSSLAREKGRVELCEAIDQADLIVFALPLYIDSLPFLVTKAFEVIADHKNKSQPNKPQRLFTIINNGFPEPHHNYLALAICRRFSDHCGFKWAGALAMGAGEALCSGQELNKTKRSGPPVKHVIKALDKAGEQLAKGKEVGPGIQSLISKSPIPLVPFRIWRWLFTKMGDRWWRKQALENKVGLEELYAKP